MKYKISVQKDPSVVALFWDDKLFLLTGEGQGDFSPCPSLT